MKRILVVEDDPVIRANILELLGAEGFDAVGADDGRSALEYVLKEPPDLIISDIMMPELDGHGLLDAVRKRTDLAAMPFIFLTAKNSRADVRSGMNLGADDYITKPFTRAELLEAIHTRLQRNEACRVVWVPPAGATPARSPKEAGRAQPVRMDRQVIAADPVTRALYAEAATAARADASVMILGETGVGKDVLAGEIHRMSRRAGRPFVPLNISTLSEGVLAGELFGFEPHSFTDAGPKGRPGLFESASGGTVFLDEVGELPAAIQVKLLRVLEDRRVKRVGGRTETPIDVRFISATHKDLPREAAEGRFREDLFYRLNVIQLRVPPLRERVGDIGPLARSLVEETSRQQGRTDVPRISPKTLALLEAQPWPGNVRQLKNVLENAVVFCAGSEIETEPIEKALRASAPRAYGLPERESLSPRERLVRDQKAIEKEELLAALNACQQNQSRAAEMIGYSRGTLLARMKEHGIPGPRKKPDDPPRLTRHRPALEGPRASSRFGRFTPVPRCSHASAA